MMQAWLTARQGISSQQLRVDTIANNLANINTDGYKAVRVDFKDALYTTMQRPVKPQDGLNLELGTGTLVAGTNRTFTQGAPRDTGNLLDFCIVGDGFFTVLDAQGNRRYTREGVFGLSVEGEKNYLVTARGEYVLDASGQKIALPEGGPVSVDSAGNVVVEGAQVARLGIATFRNAQGLEAVGGNCYAATDASGEAVMAEEEGSQQVLQGALESSNVDLAQEMTRLIRAQRLFSLSGKALAAADEMDRLANNMRG